MIQTLSSVIRGESGSRATSYQTLPTGPDEVTAGQSEEKHDAAVYLSFWILGAGCVLGWSALICTFPLFTSFFSADSSIGQNLPSLLSTVYCFGTLVFLGTAQRAVSRGQSSPTSRLRWSLLFLMATFLLTTFPLLPLLLPSLSRRSSPLLLPVLLGITTSLNFSTSYFQSSVLALASLWGANEVLASMSGQGGIAVLISAVQVLLAILGTRTDTEDSGGRGESTAGTPPSMLATVGLWGLGTLGAGLCYLAFRFLRNHPNYSRITATTTPLSPSTSSGFGAGATITATAGSSWKRTLRLMNKNRLLYLAVAYDFAITLSVFPAITSLIVTTHAPTPRLLREDIFIPVHFLMFNIGDYIGRTYLPNIPGLLTTSHPRILLLSLARTGFIPLFLMCNLATQAGARAPIINSDFLYILILLGFGATNGYLGSLSIIVASTPDLNPALEEDEKDIAGTLGVFWLMAGLTLGSMASFGVNQLVRR